MPRKIKVTTVSMPPQHNSIDANWARALSLVDAAGAQRPDLICLPETMLHVGVGRSDWPAGVQSKESPFVDQLSERARRFGAYIVGSLYVEAESGYPNRTVVIDREGNLAGMYDKVHPTYKEIDSGVTPGTRPQVMETDFGRLGLAICFDIGWPGHWAALAQQGAELVVWPSAYDGGFPLQVYAWTHFYYVVSSVWGDHSKIIDITGRVLASTSHWNRLVSEQIDLEKQVFHIDDQVEKLLRIQATMGDRVCAQGFSQENIFTLESNDGEWPLARIQHEFGLETFREYHARSTRIQDAARNGAAGAGKKIG